MMKKKNVLFLAFCLNIVLSQRAFPFLSKVKSTDVGNGGDALVCTNPSEVKMLDFTEGELRYNLHLDHSHPMLGSDQSAILERIELQLKKLERFDAILAKKILEESQLFFEKVAFVSDSTLRDIPDSDEIFIPQNCHLEQIAIQLPNPRPVETTYFVARQLWERMDGLNRAGLVLHEVIYRMLIHQGQKNSISARFFNSLINSVEIEEMSEEKFLSIIESISPIFFENYFLNKTKEVKFPLGANFLYKTSPEVVFKSKNREGDDCQFQGMEEKVTNLGYFAKVASSKKERRYLKFLKGPEKCKKLLNFFDDRVPNSDGSTEWDPRVKVDHEELYFVDKTGIEELKQNIIRGHLKKDQFCALVGKKFFDCTESKRINFKIEKVSYFGVEITQYYVEHLVKVIDDSGEEKEMIFSGYVSFDLLGLYPLLLNHYFYNFSFMEKGQKKFVINTPEEAGIETKNLIYPYFQERILSEKGLSQMIKDKAARFYGVRNRDNEEHALSLNFNLLNDTFIKTVYFDIKLSNDVKCGWEERYLNSWFGLRKESENNFTGKGKAKFLDASFSQIVNPTQNPTQECLEHIKSINNLKKDKELFINFTKEEDLSGVRWGELEFRS